VCRLTIDENGQLGITDFSEGVIPFDYDFSNAINVAIYNFQRGGTTVHLVGDIYGGRIIVRSEQNKSGITITTLDKSINLNDFRKYYNISSGELDMTAFYYTTNGKDVVKKYVFTNEPPEVVYTVSDPNVENIWIINERIYWWKWIDAITGATYSISLNDLSAEPELVSSSIAEPIEIIEIIDFDF